MKLTDTIEKEYADLSAEKKTESLQQESVCSKLLSTCKTYLNEIEKRDTLSLPQMFWIKELKVYEEAEKALQGISYCQEDISALCFYMQQFTDIRHANPIGVFFSRLINQDYEKTKTENPYSLVQEFFGIPLSSIGFLNAGAAIIIKGNAGDYIGKDMSSGSILVEGNCKNQVGDKLRGGEIVIQGNVGILLGHEMQNGKITVKGNADREVGQFMNDGIIIVEGEIKRISGAIFGGKIYSKNKMVYP